MTTTKQTRAEAERLRQKAYELMESPLATPDELESALALLHQFREKKPGEASTVRERELFMADAAKAGFERRAEVRSTEEVNPLDDDERLREVRMMVFGCAPD